MNITVRAGSWARKFLGGETRVLQTENQVTAFDAAMLAGIPRDEVGMISIGGNAIEPNRILQDKDEILVYPVIIGG